MKFITYEIKGGEHYLFSIGSRVKPDSLLRERIEASINEAMEAVKYTHVPTSWGSPSKPGQYDTRWKVEISQTQKEEDSGSEDIPEIDSKKNYLIFEIVQSEDRLEEEELKALQFRTAENFSYLRDPQDRGKIGLVILQDCTVKRIVIPGPKPSGGIYF